MDFAYANVSGDKTDYKGNTVTQLGYTSATSAKLAHFWRGEAFSKQQLPFAAPPLFKVHGEDVAKVAIHATQPCVVCLALALA